MFKKQIACQLEELPDNLVKLKNITQSLDFTNNLRPNVIGTIKEFKLDAGTSYMVGLFKNPVMAVSRVYSSAGTEFPQHEHDEWELMLVYQGELHLKIGEKIIKLKEKEFYYVVPGTSHGAYYPVDSWVLCVTMPANEDFPEGG